jgi:hypothetical protein
MATAARVAIPVAAAAVAVAAFDCARIGGVLSCPQVIVLFATRPFALLRRDVPYEMLS